MLCKSEAALRNCCSLVQAIAAMDAALRADPGDREVLLALGVSHTNEMEASEALGYLQRWLGQHPQHGAAAGAPAPPDASQRHLHVVRSAAAWAQPPLPRCPFSSGMLQLNEHAAPH